jgi:hypothetical protein
MGPAAAGHHRCGVLRRGLGERGEGSEDERRGVRQHRVWCIRWQTAYTQ